MGVTFQSVTVSMPGAPQASYEGTLAVGDGAIVFRTDGAEEPLYTWRVPRLSDGPEGPVLRLFTLMGATAFQIGTLERLAMVTLRGVEREHLERVLVDNGYPKVVQSLTLAASELASLRSWGILFVLIGLSNADTGLHAVTGYMMCAVGAWALFAGPRIGILAANGLLLLALAAKNMQQGASPIWAALLGGLGFRQVQRWMELKPLLANPLHAGWVRAKLVAPHDAASDMPAGYGPRTVAFVASTVCGIFAAFCALPALLSGGKSLAGLDLAGISGALSAWYLLVTVNPLIAARGARRVMPTSGPFAVLLYPLVIAMCLLVMVAGRHPPQQAAVERLR